MTWPLNRRECLQSVALTTAAAAVPTSAVPASTTKLRHKLTGAQIIASVLKAQEVGCVFGIPGAQENELWDEFKSFGIPYLCSAHEFGASAMADGYARVTGRPGVLCVVPGPGVTNALTGLGEALLDSVPIVALVGDVANGEQYRPFQVHSLDTVGLLKPVCKTVLAVNSIDELGDALQTAFLRCSQGEPGPVAVVVPFHLLIEATPFTPSPRSSLPLPYDEACTIQAIRLLMDKKRRIGIYAGVGCQNCSAELAAVAELLQAPVATSVSGKGAISDAHPLAVGWGFGPHASRLAEQIFQRDFAHPLSTGVNTLLAIGVKFSEVSTGFYGNPNPGTVIHVDVEPANLGRILTADVKVVSDAGVFLRQLLNYAEHLRRPTDPALLARIRRGKIEQDQTLLSTPKMKCGHHPLHLIAALRACLPQDAGWFTDVSAAEHFAAEYVRLGGPRQYFNPVDNQSMGWSIPAAIGAQRACPQRTIVTLTGDGCFLMAMQELSTAARAGLAVKCFVLDDHAYHYMQILQDAAYKRTTATNLARLDYAALAQGLGVGYVNAPTGCDLRHAVHQALAYPGPVLVRVTTDYGDLPIRWIEAVRKKYAQELSPAQKARFLARLAGRTFRPGPSD